MKAYTSARPASSTKTVSTRDRKEKFGEGVEGMHRPNASEAIKPATPGLGAVQELP